MKNIWAIKILLGAALVFAGTAGASATVNIYLKFPGVTGESQSPRHRGEIDVLGFSANASRTAPISVFGGGSGRVSCGQVTIVKNIDRASPQLLGLLFAGAHTAGPVTLSFETNSETPFAFYKIDLSDVTMLSVSQTDPADMIVRETIVLQANQYRYTYTPQLPTGEGSPTPVTFGWNCATNRAL